MDKMTLRRGGGARQSLVRREVAPPVGETLRVRECERIGREQRSRFFGLFAISPVNQQGRLKGPCNEAPVTRVTIMISTVFADFRG